MYDQTSSRRTAWIWGLLIALILILLSTRGRVGPENPALVQAFAVQPTPALPAVTLPQLDLGSLPPEAQALALEVSRRLGLGQSARPIVPTARTARVEVTIQELRQAEGGIQVVGTVLNVGAEPIEVPISAFELRDSSGASYVAGGGGSARLSPGDSTPLELTVPLPPGRGLLLITTLPPDPPVEQILIATTSP